MTELLVQRILLKLENEDYKEAKALMDGISSEEDSDKSIRNARREIEKGNFEKAQLALDEYLYAFHHEAIRQQLIHGDEELGFISRFVRITDEPEAEKPKGSESILLNKKRLGELFDLTERNETSETYCSACQQDPCMCSDPY